MAIREIRVVPDPFLRKKSRTVKDINEHILELIKDMEDTLLDAEGLGLAAPQVGALRRVILVRFLDDEERLDEDISPKAYINPEIVESSDDYSEDIEGCLSVPDRRGYVERPNWIVLEYTDVDGVLQSERFEGYQARVFCHEMDHLNGHLWTDFMTEEIFDINELDD